MSNVFYYEPFYDFERIFDEAFAARRASHNNNNHALQRNAPGDGAVRLIKPRMDLHEDAEKNLVTATFELPGLVKDNVQIDIQNNRLTVSAEAKQADEFNEHGYAVRERRFGKFSRTLQLPAGVKDDEIKASMENGVLSVSFPKSAPELAPKKISIS
ncbi:hypothetical protein GALMADRAFT_901156 [Galerina marginata CBS 339.88]|uniref:Uncharacterized protein n=1 Tax=Galerina marginata (strain CBS 339.88) TaxID=685588 RepID=A0A067SGK5_GALM3|nr:hypothetical protein GALMADRAFT_901156 [Galerina marginata CBS 339.88]